MIVIIFVLVLIYLAFLSDKVDYGAKQISKVRIPNAPEEVGDLLKTTTYRGDLIFVYLISVFSNDKRLSQTELVNRVKDQFPTQLTHQSIRNYIIQLQKHGLIRSPGRTRDYEYTLTERGRWCAGAIRICFPKTMFWFIIRHHLGLRRIEAFPEDEPQQHLN